MALQATRRVAVRPTRRRAVGIIRVSKVGDRSGSSFVSPTDQRRSIEAQCQRQDVELIAVFEELDVSGGAPLSKRPGMLRGIQMIEAGQADVILAAYFDRLIRSLSVQQEILHRIESVGGGLAAVDCGEIRSDTAAHWLSSTMLGAVAEYHRRITSEKVAGARVDAIGRGVPTFPGQVPGYRRSKHGPFEVDEHTAPIMAEAFRKRAHGESLAQVRSFLAEHGIQYSYAGVRKMLKSRVFLGELHAGKLINLTAHPPIVDRDIWQRAQRVKVQRGPRLKSEDRLLARLGILRCGRCDYKMSTSTVSPRRRQVYPVYRCGMMGHCSGVSISAPLLERLVSNYVRDLLADRQINPTLDADLIEAEAEYERRSALLDAAIEAFELISAARAKERLIELQASVDEAVDRLARLRDAVAPAAALNAAGAWDEHMTFDEKRALIRATLRSVTVHQAFGPGRRGAGAGDAATLERLTFEELQAFPS